MIPRNVVRRSWFGASFAALPLLLSASAHASSPLEYPDNGSESFMRGGAGLASGHMPIAGHYNPAALALQLSGMSLDANYAFNKTCFDRRNPGNARTGPAQGTSDDTAIVYRPVCSRNADYPTFLPSLTFVYRVSTKVGVGLAFVFPSAYPQRTDQWPDLTPGYNTTNNQNLQVANPGRYMTMGNGSTIAFPTLSIGYAVTPEFRVGVGFVWGMGIIDSTTVSSQTISDNNKGDSAGSDVRSDYFAQDLFMPGVVASVDWSPTSNIDVAGWYRYIDALRTDKPELTMYAQYYNSSGTGTTNSQPQYFSAAALSPARFTYKIPMEARAAVRYHQSRQRTAVMAAPPGAGAPPAKPVRDPLADDVFDIELEGTWSNNSAAATIETRAPDINGIGVINVQPSGFISPNSDTHQNWKDSFGVRLGGEYVVAPRKFAILVGTWVETAAQDAADLDIQNVAALRGGFGGGFVFRQDRFDLQIGYQRHWNAGLDNGGNGNLHAGAGVTSGPGPSFQIGGPRGELEFRTPHTVNGGSVAQSANVFTLGGTLRFE